MQIDKHKAVLAFDFDNTLALIGKWPDIIGLQKGAKEALIDLYNKNYYIIIWTCRGNECDAKNLEAAAEFLKKNGVPFHKVNEHHPYLIEKFQNDTRKICADIYIDDKNLYARMHKDYPNFHEIVEEIEEVCNDPYFISVLH